MPFQPGNSGHPEGQRRAKQFAEALRMEIAAAGDDKGATPWRAPCSRSLATPPSR